VIERQNPQATEEPRRRRAHQPGIAIQTRDDEYAWTLTSWRVVSCTPLHALGCTRSIHSPRETAA
jgi:hypothetical protein